MESESQKALRKWKKKRIRELNKHRVKVGPEEVFPLSTEELEDVEEEDEEEEGEAEVRYLIVWRARMFQLAYDLAKKRGKPRYIG